MRFICRRGITVERATFSSVATISLASGLMVGLSLFHEWLKYRKNTEKYRNYIQVYNRVHYEGMDVLAVREATRFAIDYCSVQAKVTMPPGKPLKKILTTVLL